MGDRVFVSGLELYCIIGLNPWERQVMQKVRIDLEMEADCRAAGLADDLSLGLDYRAVAKCVQAVVEGSSFQLVEALAEGIATTVLREFPAASSVRVRAAKPGAVRWAEFAGAEILRTRSAAS